MLGIFSAWDEFRDFANLNSSRVRVLEQASLYQTGALGKSGLFRDIDIWDPEEHFGNHWYVHKSAKQVMI